MQTKILETREGSPQVTKLEIEIHHSELETAPEVGGGMVFGMFVIITGLFISFGWGIYLVIEYIWNTVFG